MEHIIKSREENIKFIMAGPAQAPKLRKIIESYAKKYPDEFTYLGAVYGAEKESFFKKINLMVLPSTLADETEPLIMYEAYSFGAEFMGTARGCIPSCISDDNNILTLDVQKDGENILALCQVFLRDREKYIANTMSHGALLAEKSSQQLKELIKELTVASP